jgi:hypothetical protein
VVSSVSHKPHPIRPSPAEPGKYARLPQPIDPEDMVTSAEATPIQTEKDDYLRELEWMLRTSGVP